MDHEIKERQTIAMDAVVSSQIHSIGHDPKTNTLAIQFPERKDGSQGSLYHYANFSVEEFDKFKSAESTGSHFIHHIKKFPDRFPYTKIG